MTEIQRKRLKLIDVLISAEKWNPSTIEWATDVNDNYKLGMYAFIDFSQMPSPHTYVSGMITGLDMRDVSIAFESACGFLRSEGLRPLNPLDIAPKGLTWKEYMQIDLRALRLCDSIYMMKGWHNSRGARIEHWFAKRIGLKVYYQN